MKDAGNRIEPNPNCVRCRGLGRIPIQQKLFKNIDVEEGRILPENAMIECFDVPCECTFKSFRYSDLISEGK
jgi:hypothetical protein